LEDEKESNIEEHTLSASQTRTVLSKEDVARRDMLGLNLTSVIRNACSSSEDLGFRTGSVHHKKTCTKETQENYKSFFSLNTGEIIAL
jgi:hypothetical protein